MTSETRHWFAGVDWGSETHHVCLVDAAGAVVGERAFAHGGAGDPNDAANLACGRGSKRAIVQVTPKIDKALSLKEISVLSVTLP